MARHCWTGVLTSAFFESAGIFKDRGEAETPGMRCWWRLRQGFFGEANHADYASAKAAMAYGLTGVDEERDLAPCAAHQGLLRWADQLRVPRLDGGATEPGKAGRSGRGEKSDRDDGVAANWPPEDVANAVVFLSSDVLARGISRDKRWRWPAGWKGRLLWRPEEIDAWDCLNQAGFFMLPRPLIL